VIPVHHDSSKVNLKTAGNGIPSTLPARLDRFLPETEQNQPKGTKGTKQRDGKHKAELGVESFFVQKDRARSTQLLRSGQGWLQVNATSDKASCNVRLCLLLDSSDPIILYIYIYIYTP
jgi:hypothetical protein